MRASRSRRRTAARSGAWSALAWCAIGGPALAGPGETSGRSLVAEGARLFLTDWSTTSRDGLGGDGLGPMFNERSCVACHGQGGPGGAGGSRFDVLILTDSGSKRNDDGSIVVPVPTDPKTPREPLTSDVFPGFAAERSLVLHRFAKDAGYEIWRAFVLRDFGAGRAGNPVPGSIFNVRASYRNTPALFGAGLIDSIPEGVLEAASLRTIPEFPEIKGRPGHLPDGRVARFGWKAQTATLGDFVRTACANELGLENPGHAQSPDPLRPKYKAPGLDLTDDECSSLTAFVAALPRPVEPRNPPLLKGEHLDIGRWTFAEIGCAACHLPQLGEVSGIYSDLLLHDMGQGLSDSGEYYGTGPSSAGLAFAPPGGTEWRTPPLWGLRDSAPYLHDGRAGTVAAAIAQHGGEAINSAARYRKLGYQERGYLNEFLLSLAAPPQADPKARTKAR